MASADTSIRITGHVADDAALDLLLRAIAADRTTAGWSDELIADEAAALAHVRDSVDSGNPLMFAENERRGENFPAIEAACRSLDLGYVVTVSVDPEYDTPGCRRIYDPAAGREERLDGVDDGTVPAREILDLLEGGKTAEATARLRHALAPAAALPSEFSVAPGLLREPGPRP